MDKDNEKTINEEKKRVSSNIIYNFIKTLSTLLFPIISFAYASRILGTEGIGRVNYAKVLVTYFSMLALLGMNYYGTIEVARRRNKKKELSELFVDLISINAVSTVIAYLLFFVFLFSTDRFDSYRYLIIINSFSIALIGLGMEWLYQGLEKYRYIAIRSLFIQTVSLIAMLLFVRDKNDVEIYAIVMVIATHGYNILNILGCRRLISIPKGYKPSIAKHLSPIFWLFAFAASIELYTVLDSTMLGLIKGDDSVGLYTAAIKINKITIALINSIGAVLIPHLSYYIGLGDKKKIRQIIMFGYNCAFMLSVPIFVGLLCLSKEIVLLFSGEGFSQAILSMRLITPIVIIIPFSVMTNQQTLIPMRKEKVLLSATLSAALTNLIMNSILIPRYAENGAAIATVFAELVAAIISYINAKRIIGIDGAFNNYLQYILAALPIIIYRTLAGLLFDSYALIVLFTVCISVLSYGFILKKLKNDYYLEARDIFLAKLGVVHGKDKE